LRYAKRALIVLAIVAMTLFAARVYLAERGDPLESWRTYVPHELSVRELDKTGLRGLPEGGRRVLRVVAA
jgi:hypothetical protein